MTARTHKFLPFSFAWFLLFATCVQAQSSNLRRQLQESSSWSERLKDFFTDDRCLRIEKNTNKLVDLSNWMSKMPNMNTTRLLDLALPGTHNSASFDLTTELNENDPDYGTVKQGMYDIPETVVSGWVCGYALTQSLTLSEQLQAGARYLDLRFDLDPKTNKWRGYHFLWGMEMLELLQQIDTFAKEHPKEIIVLQFGSIYNKDVTAEQKQDYANTITNLFAGKLVSNATNLNNVTVGELQQKGTNILAVVRDDSVAALSDVLLDDQRAIEDTFVPTDNVETLKAYNEQSLKDFYRLPANYSKFYKLQWILTPSTAYIQQNPLKGNLYILAEEANNRLSEFKRPSTEANRQLGNILLADYVEISPLFDILELKQYSDGSFVEEPVPEQDSFSSAAKIGLGVGVTMFICGLCCLCKFCRNRKNNKE